MDYLLLIISSVGLGFKSIFAKKGNAHLTEKHNIYTYNFFMFVIAFIATVLARIWSLSSVSAFSVMMAAFYGVFLVFGQTFLIKAMDFGSVSLSSLFYSFGFLLPTVAGVMLYKESVSLSQIISVLLIVLSLIITTERDGKVSGKWFSLILIAFLCNGAVGIVQKIFRMSEFGHEQSGFMMLSFFFGAVASFIFMPKRNFSFPPKDFLKVVSGSGITLGLVNVINVYISGVLPSIIVFPGVNGGGIIASSVLARIFIGEKLSARKKIGIAVGIVAVCLFAL